jgi:hypothetical protein
VEPPKKSVLLRGEATAAQKQELASIFAYAINFDATASQHWIIKEINKSFYLLLPKKYLTNKNISSVAVQSFIPDATQPLTEAEKALGLKINHLPTVTNLNNIKRPCPTPTFAQYFTDALPSIFIPTSMYQKQEKIPSWSLYIGGHGMTGTTICHLSLEQFKTFINFLETIQTRLLVYSSCYAAGINLELLYTDPQTGITEPNSFAIITTALTDAFVYGVNHNTQVNNGKLTFCTDAHWQAFIREITTPDCMNYNQAIKQLSFSTYAGTTVPQIKLPGLEWFFVIEHGNVASIGSIMAKTRTEPLHISTFFAEKRGHRAEPRGILLHAEQIPFEVIVDTKKINTPYNGVRSEICFYDTGRSYARYPKNIFNDKHC